MVRLRFRRPRSRIQERPIPTSLAPQPTPDILRIEALRVGFAMQGGAAEVVRGVTFRVPAGRTVALVGESGSGKTVISQSVMGLLPKNGLVLGGKILFADPKVPGSSVDLATLRRDGPEIRALRGGRMGMIFQEPMSSLSPVHTIGNQIREALILHRKVTTEEMREEVRHMLGLVGFKNPTRAYKMYPFELSGGLRQFRGAARFGQNFQRFLLLALAEPENRIQPSLQMTWGRSHGRNLLQAEHQRRNARAAPRCAALPRVNPVPRACA